MGRQTRNDDALIRINSGVIAPTPTQRIRDLERENEKMRIEWGAWTEAGAIRACLECKVDELEREVAALKHNNEREVEAMDAEIALLREQRSELRREFERSKAAVDEEVNSLHASIASLETENVELRQQNNAMDIELANFDGVVLRRDELEREVHDLGVRNSVLVEDTKGFESEIAALTSEVERLTRMAAADLLTRLDVERMAEADRADAGRFRWLVKKHYGVVIRGNSVTNFDAAYGFRWAVYCVPHGSPHEARTAIDADRAKEGEA